MRVSFASALERSVQVPDLDEEATE
jgi:hypothetical protein